MTFEEAWAALHEELALWPGWHLESLTATHSAGTRHDGESGEGWYYEWSAGSWCARTVQDGWAEREYCLPFYLHWASTPAEALTAVRDDMRLHREDPHVEHIDTHRYLPECAQCVTDWKVSGWEASDGPLSREVEYAP